MRMEERPIAVWLLEGQVDSTGIDRAGVAATCWRGRWLLTITGRCL
jgi:hypothetical protein